MAHPPGDTTNMPTAAAAPADPSHPQPPPPNNSTGGAEHNTEDCVEIDDDDEIGDDELASWAQVTRRQGQKLAPPKDLFTAGVSGVRGATRDAFAEIAAAARANEADWEAQARRYEENRNQTDPQLIIKFKIPSDTTPPTTSTDSEAIMDALIMACGLDFTVHRKWHWQLTGDVPIGNNQHCFIGYLSLAPASSNNAGGQGVSSLGYGYTTWPNSRRCSSIPLRESIVTPTYQPSPSRTHQHCASPSPS